MPRQARLDLPGLLQHVIARGIERRKIFLDDEDREAFVGPLSRLLVGTKTQCYAWALLPNHFHLLLRPTEGSLSSFMRRLQTGYAVTFNLRHRRSGHLFQNRYKSIVCDEEEYLLTLVRYIGLNPLRARLVKGLEELDRYPSCSHAVLLGNRELDRQSVDEVLARFGSRVAEARARYREFVLAGIAEGRRDELVGGGLRRSGGEKTRWRKDGEERQAYDERILGGGQFVESLWREDALRERLPPRLGLDQLVARVARVHGVEADEIRRRRRLPHLCEARAVVCYLAVGELGYKRGEVGKALHLGRAGLSGAVQRGEGAVRARPELLNLLEMGYGP
ncbi:MAG: transposase [Deltaproteobacteria bacterium]|nr:transposase [Deltaproteobacteria bacterium]